MKEQASRCRNDESRARMRRSARRTIQASDVPMPSITTAMSAPAALAALARPLQPDRHSHTIAMKKIPKISLSLFLVGFMLVTIPPQAYSDKHLTTPREEQPLYIRMFLDALDGNYGKVVEDAADTIGRKLAEQKLEMEKLNSEVGKQGRVCHRLLVWFGPIHCFP